MYFSPQVKDNLKDFFNFELLQKQLKDAIGDRTIPLIAIRGIRRTGKTSLIRVVLNSLKKKYVWLDGRDITSRDDFYRLLFEETKKHKRFKISSLSIKGIELSLESKKDFDFLNKNKIILVIDEAQLLKRFNLDSIVAYIYDNFLNIKIIVSGSDAGMLNSFLGKNNAKAPLYGRAVYELQTHRLIPDYSRKFLFEGAKQAGRTFREEEVTEAVAKIDGIIGWLTKYGWYRLKLPHKEALKRTIEEGKAVVLEEFLRFASKSSIRYKAIIKAVIAGGRWGKIKKNVKISDPQLYSMLKRLLDFGIIEKEDRNYKLTDPMLESAFYE